MQASDAQSVLALMQEYQDFMLGYGSSNLPTDGQVYDELFHHSSDPDLYLSTFRLTVGEIMAIMAQPGIASWHIGFARDQGTAGLQLVTWGVDVTGSHVPNTYYILNDTQGLNALSGAGVPHAELPGIYGNHVPKALMDNWWNSWRALMAAQQVPRVVMFAGNDATNPDQLLKGYTIPIETIMAVLENPQVTNDCEVRILLVNHAQFVPGTVAQGADEAETWQAHGASQVTQPGTLGFVLATYQSALSNHLLPVSSVYDFSAPCPPTCPDPPSG